MKKAVVLVTCAVILSSNSHIHAMDPCQFVHEEYVLSLGPSLDLQQCMLPDGGMISFLPGRDIPLIGLGVASAYLALVALAKITPRNASQRIGRLFGWGQTAANPTSATQAVFTTPQQPFDPAAPRR